MERRAGLRNSGPVTALTAPSLVAGARPIPRGLGEVLVWGGGLVTVASALHLVFWYWPGSLPLDVSSGVYGALARDAADGVLYRPVWGPLGYGGTRYMPLFFLAQGLLIRLGFDPVVSGLVLTLASALLFDLALYAAMREQGVSRLLALPFALLAHATVSVQLLTLGTKCDLLASALNLGGVALALRYVRRPRNATLVGSVLALAAGFFAKLTTISGMIAAVALLRSRRGWRPALAAAAGLLVSLSAGLVAIQAASAGRFWPSLLSVGSGGIRLSYAARFPFWFARALVEDPFSLLIFLAALFYAVRSTRRREVDFAVAYFWLGLALTAPVFASPGTDNNHLVDLLGACLILLATVRERLAESARLATLVPAALAALTAVTWMPGAISIRSVVEAAGRPQRSAIAAIAARAGAPERILSENPLVPVLAGGPAFVSDAFSLHVLAAGFPEIREDFARRMADGDFPVVVLVDWSGADASHALEALRGRPDRGVDRFYGDVRFPTGFVEQLEREYEVSWVEHPFVVFERRRSPDS